nr:MAG TPA: hypothetical protein [Caudoviricetes sp.]
MHIKIYFLCAFCFLYKRLCNAAYEIITPKETIKQLKIKGSSPVTSTTNKTA